jgi:hypothetical protein
MGREHYTYWRVLAKCASEVCIFFFIYIYISEVFSHCRQNLKDVGRYYKNDFLPDVCRNHMQFKDDSTPQSKLDAYNHIINRFHPVFRHFFLERYRDPLEWFDRRLTYVRRQVEP